MMKCHLIEHVAMYAARLHSEARPRMSCLYNIAWDNMHCIINTQRMRERVTVLFCLSVWALATSFQVYSMNNNTAVICKLFVASSTS